MRRNASTTHAVSPEDRALRSSNAALQHRMTAIVNRSRILSVLSVALATFAINTNNRFFYGNAFVDISSGVLFVAGVALAAVLCMQSLLSLLRIRLENVSRNTFKTP